MTTWKKPEWYLTTQEFAEIIIESLEENNYFKRNERAHPVDIEAAFSTTASAVAHAIDAIGKKIHDAEKTKKKALMEPSNLKKNSNDITVTSSSNVKVQSSSVTIPESDIDYLETKYGKFTK